MKLGKYEVERELGRGGFGQVLLAVDTRIGRRVAIKVIRAGIDSDSEMADEFLQRFLLEASTTAALRHQNIVTVYEFGEHEGSPFLVMEYLEGQDLSGLMKAGETGSLADRMRIMQQASAGLAHAHKNGVVHRDVKPNNIMVLRDGTVKILDFGIAKAIQSSRTQDLTKTGFQMGTLRYMAPEQLGGRPADALSDIFSFGVVYHELLSNEHPFPASSEAMLVYQIVNQQPKDISLLIPGAPERLKNAVARMLAKEPKRRYQSLEDFDVDIRPVLIHFERIESKDYAQRARSAMEAGRMQEAGSLLRKALQIDPSNAEAQQMHDSLREQSEREAVEKRHNSLIEGALDCEKKGELRQAVQLWKDALRLRPNNAQIPQRIASLELEIKKQDEGLRKLQEAKNLYARQDFPGAIRALSEALRALPNSEEAKNLLAQVQSEQKQQKDLAHIRDFEARARAQLRMQNFEGARQIVLEGLAVLPKNPILVSVGAEIVSAEAKVKSWRKFEADFARAQEFIQERKWNEARQILSKLLLENPGDSALKATLEALSEQEAGDKREEEVQVLMDKVQKLVALGEGDKAIRLLDAGVRKYSGDEQLKQALLHLTEAVAMRKLKEAEGEKELSRKKLLETVKVKPIQTRIAVPDLKLAPTRRKGFERFLVTGGILFAVLTGLAIWIFSRPSSVPELKTDRKEIVFSPKLTSGAVNVVSSGANREFEIFLPGNAVWLKATPQIGITPAKVEFSVDPSIVRHNDSAICEIRPVGGGENMKIRFAYLAPNELKPLLPNNPAEQKVESKSNIEPNKEITVAKTTIPEKPSLGVRPEALPKVEEPRNKMQPPEIQPSQVVVTPPIKARKLSSVADWGGDESGVYNWIGNLEPGGRLEIQGRSASTGNMSPARDLEPVPHSVSSNTPGVSILEAPSEANGFNRIVLRNNLTTTLNRIQIQWKLRR